ncbi:MAG: hypothetical protein EBS91_00125 [Betaproteobacteria bacterium]|jgi:hypothetical protein|nr:hypothetical protein [Betaproteobacteria bacterium]
MRYIVELRGVHFGPFETLEEARAWAKGYGTILALMPAAKPAVEVQHATDRELGEFLKAL